MIPKDYQERHMSDHEFARWLRSKGWLGGYKHLNTKGRTVFTAYCVSSKTLAIMKIKNSLPINRWIYLNPTA